MRGALLGVFCLAAALVGSAAAAERDLPAPVRAALARAGVPPSAASVVVEPADAGAPLISHQASASVNPASVMKLVTSYAALDLLGVVLFGTGTSAHRIKEDARSHIVESLGAEDVVLKTTIRHSEATAQAARERGQLVYELEDEARKGPAWWQIRRGEAAATGAPRTASGVAEDYHALAEEVVARITAAEQNQEVVPA